MFEKYQNQIEANIAEITLMYFVFSIFNWFFLSCVFLMFFKKWVIYFQTTNILGIASIVFPFLLLFWLSISLYSYYPLWDILKKIPIISDLLRKIFANESPKKIQFLFTLFWVFLIFFIIFLSYLFIISFIVLELFGIGLIFFILFGFAPIFSIPDYFIGVFALRKEKLKRIDQNVLHDAIIITHYKNQIKLPVYGDGFPKLFKYFQQNNHEYVIYNCMQPADLKTIVYNPNAKNLWIFGHGFRGGLNFGAGVNQYYSEFKDAPRKQFIAQFHCNPPKYPGEKSLAELISIWGYVTEGSISEITIRNAIETLVNIKKFN